MTTQHVHEAGERGQPTCWVLFPVYKLPLPSFERLDPADLAGAFADTATDKFGYAEWGNATVLPNDPRTPPTPAPDSEAVAEVISYRAVNLSAVVRVIPMLNGNIPLDVGTRLYAHPPTPAQPAGGWQQEQVNDRAWLADACETGWLNYTGGCMHGKDKPAFNAGFRAALAALTQPSGEQS